PLPLDGALVNGRWGTAAALADPSTYRQGNMHAILPRYFETLRTRAIAGRPFTETDNHAHPMSNTPKPNLNHDLLVTGAFPGQSAVGQRLLSRITTPEPEWFEVIGVVAHQRHSSLAVEGPETIYFADGYLGHASASRWALRTSGDPTQVVAAVRAAISEVNPRAVPAEIQPMQAFVDKA